MRSRGSLLWPGRDVRQRDVLQELESHFPLAHSEIQQQHLRARIPFVFGTPGWSDLPQEAPCQP